MLFLACENCWLTTVHSVGLSSGESSIGLERGVARVEHELSGVRDFSDVSSVGVLERRCMGEGEGEGQTTLGGGGGGLWRASRSFSPRGN